MRTSSTILLVCLSMWAIGVCGAGSASDSPLEKPVIDIAKSDTWEASVKLANDNMGKIAAALIAVAKDEKRPVEERRRAILLLGRIGNRESLGFLIGNVSLRLPINIGSGDEDRLKKTPCLHALCGGDWRAAQAILASLDEPRSETDLMYLAYPLERILFRDVALAAVERQLLQKPNEVRKKNLQILKKFLLH